MQSPKFLQIVYRKFQFLHHRKITESPLQREIEELIALRSKYSKKLVHILCEQN
jgi:hypothetical protein